MLMDKSQLALDNSNSLLTLELVHTAEVDYTELDTGDDLDNLTYTSDGIMDNVHILRDAYAADLVILLEHITFTGGLAWLLNNSPENGGSPTYGFSLSRVQQASWTFTGVHEIGHNMGLGHSKIQNTQPGPGWYDYSAGWRWTGNDLGEYCSVMAYESGSYYDDGISHARVPYFSNPNITHQGVLTGDAADGDSALSLRKTKMAVSRYRVENCIYPVDQVSSFTSSSIQNNSMTIGWTRGNGDSILVLARAVDAINADPLNGVSYTANAAVGIGTQVGSENFVVYNGTGTSVDLTALAAGTTYNFALYEYSTTENCYLLAPLTGSASTTACNVSFTYDKAAYCANAADPAPTITGLTGGTFSSTVGLSIIPSSGIIDVSASTPGIYSVTYTTVGSCPNSSSVSVTVNTASSITSVTASTNNVCANTSVNLTANGVIAGSGAILTWYNVAGGRRTSLGVSNTLNVNPAATTTYYARLDGTCNVVETSITVIVLNASFSYGAAAYCEDAADPRPTITGLKGGTFSSTSGLSIIPSSGIIDVSTSTPGTYLVTYTTVGSCPNSSSVSVTVFPLPTVTFITPVNLCVNAGVQSGLGGGTPAKDTSSGDAGVYRGTGVTDVGNGMYRFDPAIAGVGTHMLTYTYTDGNGCTNSASDDVEVFALPNVTFTAPSSPFCPNSSESGLSGGLPAGGVYSGLGVTDDGNGISYSFASLVTNDLIAITYTYTNANGCTTSISDNVIVEDNIAPIIVAQDITVELDELGTITTTAESIDNGSTDNCSIATMTIDKDTFTCDDIGENTVTLTVTDVNGSSSTVTTIITVEDNIAPQVVTKDVVIALDETGAVSVTAEEFIEESYDNCSISSVNIDRTNFDCANLGDYTITLTTIDSSGNTTAKIAILTLTGDDMDGDLIADVCDDDMDSDGVDNEEDNSPRTPNPDQADLDRDGIGDVSDNKPLTIPKGFSPNGDGVNDEFIIAGLHKFKNNALEVFNRYGHSVYQQSNYQNYWGGIGNKKEKILPAGPYYYVLSTGNVQQVVKGWVYINY
jgi:gliding motility-associated-like protein